MSFLIDPFRIVPIAASISYAGYTNGSATTNNVPIGEAANNREVFLLLEWTGSTATLTSATIGGGDATIHGQVRGTSFAWNIALISAPLKTGTTATVAMTFSAAPSLGQVRIGSVAAYGLLSSAPIDIDIVANVPEAQTTSSTIAVQADGIIIAVMGRTNAQTIIMTGADAYFDEVALDNGAFSQYWNGGGGIITEDDASYTVSMKSTSGTHNASIIVASFR